MSKNCQNGNPQSGNLNGREQTATSDYTQSTLGRYSPNNGIQETIERLQAIGCPPLPVATAQDARKHPKVQKGDGLKKWQHCPLDENLNPIPLFTGKNPSYLDKNGKPYLIDHKNYQDRLPTDAELKLWFVNPANGIGALGNCGGNGIYWIDLDRKHFKSQEDCDAAFRSIISHNDRLIISWVERTASGGYRIGVKLKQPPAGTNFALSPDGDHVGEVLGYGRFAVLAPTVGYNGEPYKIISRNEPIEVESLESIGIYFRSNGKTAPQKERPQKQVEAPTTDAISLLDLVTPETKQILLGNGTRDDRSEDLTAADKELLGWENFCEDNGISLIGNSYDLIVDAAPYYDKDEAWVNRNRSGKNFNPDGCIPACVEKGGDEAAWMKIERLSKAVFAAKCPQGVKDKLTAGRGQVNGQGTQDNQPTVSLKERIQYLVDEGITDADLQIEFIRLANEYKTTTPQLHKTYKALLEEQQRSEEVAAAKETLNRSIAADQETIDLKRYLPPDLAEASLHLNRYMKVEPEVALMLFLATLGGVQKVGNQITAWDGFDQPTSLFLALVSPSGQRKTPVFNTIVSKPLKPIQDDLWERYQTDLNQWKNDFMVWDAKKHTTIKDLRDGKPTTSLEPEPQKPIAPVVLLNGSTVEGLHKQISGQPDQGMVFFRDELPAFFKSFGEHKGGRGGDEEAYLELYDGGSNLSLRKSEGITSHFNQSHLSIIGGIQNDVLIKLLKEGDANGKFARSINIHQPLVEGQPVPYGVKTPDITGLLTHYYRAAMAMPKTNFSLSREAHSKFAQFYSLTEQQRVSSDPAYRALWGKAAGHALRIAANLHIGWCISRDETIASTVGGEIMQLAIELVKTLIHKSINLYRESNPNEELTAELKRFLDIVNRMGGEATLNNIRRKFGNGRHRPEVDEVVQLAKDLEDIGFGTLSKSGRSIIFTVSTLEGAKVDTRVDTSNSFIDWNTASRVDKVDTSIFFVDSESSTPTEVDNSSDHAKNGECPLSTFKTNVDKGLECPPSVSTLMSTLNSNGVLPEVEANSPSTSVEVPTVQPEPDSLPFKEGDRVRKRYQTGWVGTVTRIYEDGDVDVLWIGEKYPEMVSSAILELLEGGAS